jgi:hypothetical protein
MRRRGKIGTEGWGDGEESGIGNAECGIPPINILDIFDDRWTAEHMRFNYLFDSYLQGGLFPLALEEPDPLPLLQYICLKVIRRDMPMVSNFSLFRIVRHQSSAV